jgi:RNA polymerase sigma-70 factor (ECF subfamily)
VSRFYAGLYRKYAMTEAPTELNGAPALLVSTANHRFTVSIATDGGVITGLYLVSNPEKLAGLEAQTTPV